MLYMSLLQKNVIGNTAQTSVHLIRLTACMTISILIPKHKDNKFCSTNTTSFKSFYPKAKFMLNKARYFTLTYPASIARVA